MDIYQANKVNRAQIVLEEAMKGVYAAFGEAGTSLKSIRGVRDKIADMGKQMYQMQVAVEKEV